LGQARMRLDHKKRIYETDLARMPVQDQENIIGEIAKVRHDLQTHGDKLDRDIKKAEKELEALYNTFNILELENSALKAKYEGKSKAKKMEAEKDQESMLELKQQLTTIRKQVSYKKNQIAEMSKSREEYMETMMEIDRDMKEEEAVIEEKRGSVTKLKGEQKVIEEKLSRAKMTMQRNAKGLDPESDGYKDIDLRYGRSRFQNSVREAMAALKQHPSEMDLMKDYLSEGSIALPNMEIFNRRESSTTRRESSAWRSSSSNRRESSTTRIESFSTRRESSTGRESTVSSSRKTPSTAQCRKTEFDFQI